MQSFRLVINASTSLSFLALALTTALNDVALDVEGLAQPDATKLLKPCPATKWGSPVPQLSEQATMSSAGELSPLGESRGVPFLKTIIFPRNSNIGGDDDITWEEENSWIQQNASDILKMIDHYGAVVFEGFNLPKTRRGFREFCDALSPLEACEDALAEIGVRSLLSVSDGVYRAVDSEKLAKTFIGLHNDCTYKLAPPYAAFACLHQADSGGEFLLADGREVLQAMDADVIKKLCERGLRVRVATIPTPFLAKTIENSRDVGTSSGATLQDLGSQLLERVVGWGVRVFFTKLALEVAFTENREMLQILEPLKSPLNAHPKDGKLSFFSGIHSQSAYLQQKRAADAFSGVAMTDVFYGEDDATGAPMEAIETETLDHIEDVIDRHTTRLLMKPGDVVLLDSYQVLHGRATFKGFREHAVIWLTNEDY